MQMYAKIKTKQLIFRRFVLKPRFVRLQAASLTKLLLFLHDQYKKALLVLMGCGSGNNSLKIKCTSFGYIAVKNSVNFV